MRRAVTLMGGPGSGQLTKMFNQICIAGLVQALAEGIAFAERAGLDVERALDVISKGAAQSWQMENRGRTMLADKFDFGFAVDWMRKDLALCLAEARARGAALPVTALVDQFYARVQAQGGGRWDSSSLIRVLRDQAVTARPGSRAHVVAGTGSRSPSTIAISKVISAVFASIWVAEQYLSFDSFTARSTWRGIEPSPGHRVPEVDPGEDPGLRFRALRLGVHGAVRDRLARLAQDHDDVECRAGGRPEEHQLHRSHPTIAAAVVGRTVNYHGMPAFRFADEAHAFHPFRPDLHSPLALRTERRIVPHLPCGNRSLAH